MHEPRPGSCSYLSLSLPSLQSIRMKYKREKQLRIRMMTNNTTIVKDRRTEYLFVAYYPLFLVLSGTILNLFTFIILSRSSFGDRRKQTTIHYMRAIAIFDILMLYGWNLDHYVYNVHGILLQKSSILLCKILSFLNYFAAQSSAWLRVFMCFDRYMSLSRLHRTWLNQPRNILLIILSIVGLFTLLNFHIILFACFYTEKGKISVNARRYHIYPYWDWFNLAVYNCIPFALMAIFNSGVIYHLIQLRRSSTIRNSRIQHRAISVTLVITTFLFSLMTIPATVSFAFFYSTASVTILHLLDSVLYTYHVLSFPLYLLTFSEFRHECFDMLQSRTKRRTASMQSRTGPWVIGTS